MYTKGAFLTCFEQIGIFIFIALVSIQEVRADFQIAFSSSVETKPAVAYNTQTNEFIVAYLVEQVGGSMEVRIKRFDSAGNQQGVELAPFGVGTHEAVGRPDIAYSHLSNIFYLAVPERLSSNDRVLARPIAADGSSLPIPSLLFDDGISRVYDEDGAGHSVVRVTFNSIRNEFLVSYQHTTPSFEGDVHSVVARRIDGGFPVGVVSEVYTSGLGGFGSHSLAYAPVQTVGPVGGRYLFGVGTSSITLRLLDADANVIPTASFIPFDTGEPNGRESQPDIAYGRVEGRDRFLVVWSDGNNCKWPLTSCSTLNDQWTGVWGSYIDPSVTAYGPGPINKPFPISKIISHLGSSREYTPRVVHNDIAQTFFVSWRELPFNYPLNIESRSHIRGNLVDYFVSDDTSIAPPEPHNNILISDITGSCPPTTPPLIPGTCPSNEDPMFPDVIATSALNAIVVWDQQYPPNPSDKDVWGDKLRPVVQNDDCQNASTIGVGQYVGSLVGGTNDGGESCSTSLDQPDIWYQFFAPAVGVLRVDTCGTHDEGSLDGGTDTIVSLHLACPGTVDNEQACNDDWPDSNIPAACSSRDVGLQRDSAVERRMEKGEQLLVRISRYDQNTGVKFKLNVNFTELDSDGDGVLDDGDGSGIVGDHLCSGGNTVSCDDNCVNTSNTNQADVDSDGVGDVCDNCTIIVNLNQRDTDNDGYGNMCDADLDQNGFVNIKDMGLFKQVFGTSDPNADFDGNGFVNIKDLAILKSLFGKPPGPSGL